MLFMVVFLHPRRLNFTTTDNSQRNYSGFPRCNFSPLRSLFGLRSRSTTNVVVLFDGSANNGGDPASTYVVHSKLYRRYIQPVQQQQQKDPNKSFIMGCKFTRRTTTTEKWFSKSKEEKEEQEDGLSCNKLGKLFIHSTKVSKSRSLDNSSSSCSSKTAIAAVQRWQSNKTVALQMASKINV